MPETSSSPPGPVPGAPPLASQLQLHPGAQTPVPSTMLVVSGPDALFCLLLLLLLGSHNPVGTSPPQRRFEYKLSFKGPRLALPGAGIPFWSHHGGEERGRDQPCPGPRIGLEGLTSSGRLCLLVPASAQDRTPGRLPGLLPVPLTTIPPRPLVSISPLRLSPLP